MAALRVVVSSTAGARWDEVCTVEGFLLPRGKAVCAAMELLQGLGRLAALGLLAAGGCIGGMRCERYGGGRRASSGCGGCGGLMGWFMSARGPKCSGYLGRGTGGGGG